jgi:hypothetical protein
VSYLDLWDGVQYVLRAKIIAIKLTLLLKVMAGMVYENTRGDLDLVLYSGLVCRVLV